MHCRRVGEDAYLVVLEKDEKVAANLVKVAGAHDIEGGWVQGLGSLRDIEIGWYDVAKRSYLRRRFEEDMELTGLSGNIAMVGPERVLHAHASVSGPELISFSGHLFEARVAASAEFLLQDLGVRLERTEAASTGLKLLVHASGKPRRGGRSKKETGA